MIPIGSGFAGLGDYDRIIMTMNSVSKQHTPELPVKPQGMRAFVRDMGILTLISLVLLVATIRYPDVDLLDSLRFGVLGVLLLRLTWHYFHRSPATEAGVTDASTPAEPLAPPVSPLLRLLCHPLFYGALIAVLFIANARPFTDLYTDEGIWYYVAFAWLKYYLPPYLGTVENKTPGIFYLFALAFRLFGLACWFPRLLGIIALGITSSAIYQIGKLLANRLAGTIAMLLYALCLTGGYLYNYLTALTETFMICFSVLAFLALITAQRTAHARGYRALLVLTGCCVGVAIAFKQIAVITSVAVVAYYLTPVHRRHAVGAPSCAICCSSAAGCSAPHC